MFPFYFFLLRSNPNYIVVDFLRHFHLLADPFGNKLVDTVSHQSYQTSRPSAKVQAVVPHRYNLFPFILTTTILSSFNFLS
jgi:hypothetical protein